jgi:hypothetical protein
MARLLAIALLVLWILPLRAPAATVLLHEAHETHSALIDLPDSSSGRMSFRRCGDCAFKTVRASDSTLYELHGTRVSLAQLRAALARKSAALAVVYDVKTLLLIRISAY